MCSLKNSQKLFMQLKMLIMLRSYLFSLLLNKDIVDIEKPDGIVRWKSKTRVTSCQLRVQMFELRVQIHEFRVQIHKLQVQIHELRVPIHELGD